ncbi:MAG: cation diffusion facilitator family transporter [Prevotellaceae bacterium]|jgi:cobalt-zinc-cadmium efflux system protein|nr:cation diffusion facilitator family transporter [Prevotellaceae bacterium]
MDHHHGHTQGRISGNIDLAFFLNLGFAVIELTGGLLTNSVAILSDAFHDAGDCVSLGVSWYLQKVSGRGRDKRYSYGYRRFSLLGALFLSVVLLIGSAFIIKESIARIIAPEPAHAQGMLLLAVLGIAINGLAALRMRKGASFNERAIFVHIMEDVLGWIAVLAASVVMLLVDFPVIDPILSLAICVWVLYNVYKNLKGTLKVLLQEIPGNVDTEKLETALCALEHVLQVHDLHVWTLDGEQHIMTLHAVISGNLPASDRQALKASIKAVCDGFDIHHVTVEFETETEKCECECTIP